MENPNGHKPALSHSSKDTHTIGRDHVQYRNKTSSRSDGKHRPKPANPAGPHNPDGKGGADHSKRKMGY
jgi:hypothetical protein